MNATGGPITRPICMNGIVIVAFSGYCLILVREDLYCEDRYASSGYDRSGCSKPYVPPIL